MLVETISYRGREIEVHADDDPMDPREWDNLGTMVCWHGRYNLGDERPSIEAPSYLKDLAEVDAKYCELEERLDAVERAYGSRHEQMFKRACEFVRKKRKEVLSKRYVILPLYLYDHSGITMNTSGFSCGWDSGQVGFIYCSLEKARENWGLTPAAGWDFLMEQVFTDDWFRGKTLRECTTEVLTGEVETYDQYLRGDVYGYIAGDDSCWGFFGYDHEASSLLEQARAAIDYAIKAKREAHFKQLKTWIRSRVPLCVRQPASC